MTPYRSDWYKVCACHKCGFSSRWSHEVSPCGGCGGYGATGSWDEFVVRDVRYTPFQRFVAWLHSRRLPPNHREWKREAPACLRQAGTAVIVE